MARRLEALSKLAKSMARFMANSQVPWGLEAASGTISDPAWRSKPSWYLFATQNRMIAPDARRAMATHAGARIPDVAGSHAVFVAKPDVVASLIEEATSGAPAGAPQEMHIQVSAVS